MLRIRLRRVGKKKRPAYRVVVADSRAPRDGAFVDILGLYDPLTEPLTFNINEEKTRYWLSKGAQPSETTAKLLRRRGIETSVAVPKRAGHTAGSGAAATTPAASAPAASAQPAAAAATPTTEPAQPEQA